MTVPVQDPEVAHTGNGITTSFAFPFLVFEGSDLLVRVDGTLGVLNVDYTVTGLALPAGGNVIFTTAPESGASVTIQRSVPLARLTDYQYAGDFQSPTVNRDFDRTWMAIQDTKKGGERALRLPVGDLADTTIPDAADRALKGLAFDASGNIIAAPASDATSLAAALQSAALDTTGAGIVGFDVAKNYPVGTVGAAVKTGIEFPTDISDDADAAKGTALVGYLAAYTGAVGRTLADKLNDAVSAKDFGLATTNTGAQNNTAIALAIAYAVAQGGLTLHIPRGTYNFAMTIDTSAANNLRITGDGIDATILQINHATADFISTGSTIYQTVDNLTLTSSVTRTAGSMVKTGYWRRGMLFRVKIEKHYNGVNLFQFEHCTLMETNIVSPTGAGTALTIGNPAATNQGANINLLTVFIRGNDETVPEGPAVGSRGILVYDIEAIYAFNLDVSAMTDEIMVISPNFQTANCFFTSCYFDITVGGDNILFQGAGIKNRIQFSNCWIAGAGRFGAGAVDKYGVRLGDVGSYISLAFDACAFIGTSGPGFGTFTPQSEALFTGCVFNNCGLNTTLNTAVYASFSATQTKFMQFTGCKFIPSPVTTDFVFTSNARGNMITGCELLRGISYQGGAQFGHVSGNSDPSTPNSVASAATLLVPLTKSHLFVSGTTNVGGLFRTYTGHVISLTAASGFTWLNGGALALKGNVNFVAAASNVLTVVCREDGSWQEISRSA